MDHHYIVVEGPLGVGKTALTGLLCERLGGRAVLEKAEENPFLPGFYGDPKAHAFQAQIFFLLSRYRQQQALLQPDLFRSLTVSDSLFAKDRLFACVNLEADELALYDRVFQALEPRVAKPDLVIYLQARLEVLLQRIRQRGRDFERKMEPGYLGEVVEAYHDFFFHYGDTPLLVVDTSDVDFARHPADLEHLISVISKMRKGTQHYIPRPPR